MSKLKIENESTILKQTKHLLTLCKTEEKVNKKHIVALMETLRTFFHKYEGCPLPSIVWEIVDKIIILEGTFEEKKKIDVDLDTSKKLCEYIFEKLLEQRNQERPDIVYVFSFICLKRQLCSLINTLIHFNHREIRRKIEASFTNELINLIKRMFESVKNESDLEIKKFYAEFLWRSFRRIDMDSTDIKKLNVRKQTIEKLKNFGMTKFDEVCINWLREENYIDKKRLIEKGSFTITANKNTLQKEFLLCYIGDCSLILYFNNDEGDETCRMEIPYYHILSIQQKENNIFNMECKAIVEQTNIYTLWGDYAKNSIDHEIVSKFTVSLLFKKISKEAYTEMLEAIHIINERISIEKKKKMQSSSMKAITSKNEKNKNAVGYVEKSEKEYQNIELDTSSKECLVNDDETFSNIGQGIDQTINSFSALLLKSKTRKRIDTLTLTEKRKKCNEHSAERDKAGSAKAEDNSNFKKDYETEELSNEFDFKETSGQTNSIEKDSDMEMMLQKIIECHKKKKEQFQVHLKKSFADALAEINERIKALVEKQKNRREELRKKFERKKQNIVTQAEKDLFSFTKEIKLLMDKIKKISVNQNEVSKLLESGSSLMSTNDILIKSQELVQKIRESLDHMNFKITNKQKEYNKRKKLCYKALSTAYE